MLKSFSVALAALIALVGLMATLDVAQAASKAPLGFQLMCIKQPEQCKSGGAARLILGDDTMATLKRVNLAVNRSIRPRNDGRADVWTVNAKSGDCEDYVLTKRARLIALGLAPSALRIAYVKTRSGEGHALLVIKTDKGDYVLDNLTSAIKPLSQTRYRLVAISGANPKVWS